MHRSYEIRSPIYLYWFADRVGIHSPGGLFGRVDAQSFGRPGTTDYRNPSLAASMKILGFVQQFGIGVALAKKACANNGNSEPEFEFAPNAVSARVRRRA